MNSTVFMVLIVPFLVGILLGAVLFKWKRSRILSAVFAAVSVVVWIRTKYLADHGVDGTVMLAACMAAEFTVGFATVGGIAWLARKRKHWSFRKKRQGQRLAVPVFCAGVFSWLSLRESCRRR